MNSRVLLWMSVLLCFGCTQEKRLGESFIEHRRYRHGWHVQLRQDVHQNESAPARAAMQPRAESVLPTRQEGLIPAESSPHVGRFAAMEGKAVTATSTASPDGHYQGAAQGAARRAAEKAAVRLVPRPAAPLIGGTPLPHILKESVSLPDPIDGRHPASVPGFILSLGWLLGILGEVAVDYLQMPLSGVSIVVGFVATMAGYFISRKAYRASLAHPDLYPRYRLSKVGRILSFAPLAPVLLYAGIVVLLVLLLGGL